MEPVPNRAPETYTPEQSAWLEEAHQLTNKITDKYKLKENYDQLEDLGNRGMGLFGAKAGDHLAAYKKSRKK